MVRIAHPQHERDLGRAIRSLDEHWDGQGHPLATLRGHSGAVEAVAISPDGRSVVSGGLDATIRAWSVADRRASSSS